MIRIAFVCVHNSCRSQIAEALCRHFAEDVFECCSAGTKPKERIDADAVRIVRQIYGIDMEKTQFPKRSENIPPVDVVISMGCDASCPNINSAYKEDWGIEDPSGRGDDVFKIVIKQIEEKVLELKANFERSDN